jgi:hypothetical protein
MQAQKSNCLYPLFVLACEVKFLLNRQRFDGSDGRAVTRPRNLTPQTGTKGPADIHFSIANGS